MERIWLRNYPPGVPAEIDPSQYRSLLDIFDESFKTHRDKGAFVCMGATKTFGEVEEASRAFAAWLQSLGMPKGSRVAIMLPNILQSPVAMFGTLRAGMTVVNVNPLYKPRELEFQLNDSGAEVIVVLENFASVLQHAMPHTKVKHVVIARMGDMLGLLKGAIVNMVVRHVKKMVPVHDLPDAHYFKEVLSLGARLPFKQAELGPDDIAFLQYTGGTTGVSKGATLSHRNVVANTMQANAWLQPALQAEPQVGQLFMVGALPLYHIFALTACALMCVRLGGLCLLIPNPRDIPALLKELSKYDVHFFPAVNTLFNAMLNHPDFHKVDWKKLKSAVGGGMAVQKQVADRWLQETGKPIIEAYGLSETSPGLTANRCDITEWTGGIGYPFPSTDLKILDPGDKEVPIGEAGEICARGPQVMVGYWNRPDETEKVMTADGFFRTGDIGIMDETGMFRIVDRKKDMISVSGFKVFPNEVEDQTMLQGNIAECAAIGVPDANSGEVVKLFVVKKTPELTEDEIRIFLRGKLAGYKIPKYIEFRNDLPKTNVGKILRRALRDGEGA